VDGIFQYSIRLQAPSSSMQVRCSFSLLQHILTGASIVPLTQDRQMP
jgi:hypothetical protein